jgi:Flp pilus assembly protein TadG
MNVTAPMKTRLRADSGQSLVEFAITAIVFLLLVFSILDFSYLYFAKVTLQSAVRQGGRYAITGQAMTSKTRYDSILQTVKDSSLGFATNSNATISIYSALGGSQTAGGPGDTITIAVTYNYYFITPMLAVLFTNGTYQFNVSASFKNEPFPPSQT